VPKLTQQGAYGSAQTITENGRRTDSPRGQADVVLQMGGSDKQLLRLSGLTRITGWRKCTLRSFIIIYTLHLILEIIKIKQNVKDAILIRQEMRTTRDRMRDIDWDERYETSILVPTNEHGYFVASWWRPPLRHPPKVTTFYFQHTSGIHAPVEKRNAVLYPVEVPPP
jgi:hypothetical protein